jgi:hypothetical protein
VKCVRFGEKVATDWLLMDCIILQGSDFWGFAPRCHVNSTETKIGFVNLFFIGKKRKFHESGCKMAAIVMLLKVINRKCLF